MDLLPSRSLNLGPPAHGTPKGAAAGLVFQTATAFQTTVCAAVFAHVARFQPRPILLFAHQFAAIAHKVPQGTRQVPRLAGDRRWPLRIRFVL